jgi:hypothetical protein
MTSVHPLRTLDEKPDQQPFLSSSSADTMPNVHDPSAKEQESREDVTAADENGTALEPVQSRHVEVNGTSEVPNGGLLAWLQVFGAFFLTFNSWYDTPHVRLQTFADST